MATVSRFQLLKRRLRLGVDLLTLRLQMARLEWQEYQQHWGTLLMSAIALFACILLGGLGLLFALQAALPQIYAVWAFGGICVLSAIIALILYCRIRKILAGQSQFLQETLGGLADDLAILRGQVPSSELFEDISGSDQ